MAIDPSIILGVKQPQFTQPDPIEQYGKVAALKALIRKEDDDAAMRDVYRQAGGDRNAVVNKLLEAGLVQPAMAQQKANLEDEAKRAQVKASTAKAGLDAVRTTQIADGRFGAHYATILSQGATDDAISNSQLPDNIKSTLLNIPSPDGRKGFLAAAGMSTEQGVKAMQLVFPQQTPVALGDRVQMTPNRVIPGVTAGGQGASMPINVSPNTVAANTVRQQEGAANRQNALDIAGAGNQLRADIANSGNAGIALGMADPVRAPAMGVSPSTMTARPGGMQIPPAAQAANDSDRAAIQRKELAQEQQNLALAQSITDPTQREKAVKIHTSNIESLNKELGSTAPSSTVREAIAKGLTGDEFLKAVPPQMQQLIKKVASYDIDPRTLSTRGGHREQVLSLVSQYDPTYDDKEYANSRRAITQFGSGPQGNTTRSLNVAIDHMQTVRKAGEALKNGDVQVFNRLGNEIAKQTGKAAPTTFEALKDILADEVIKGIVGNTNALADRQAAADKVRLASSPAQLAGVLDGWTELLGGQMRGLEKQYEGATRKKDFRERYLTPLTVDAMAKVSAEPQNRRATDVPARPVVTSESARLEELKNANDAIRKGANREAVAKRYRERTGVDLP